MSKVRPFLNKQQLALVTRERKLPRERAEVIAFRSRATDLVDEMESAGDEGLCWAARAYSEERGTEFRAFAKVVVDRAILGFLRSEMRHRKLAVGGYVVASWGACHVEPRAADVLDPLQDSDDRALEKLRGYVDLKVVAGVAALCAEAEQHRQDPERSAAFSRLMEVVEAELDVFNPLERGFFVAIYWEGKTVEEAAAAVGMPPDTAKARHRGLLGRLRKAVAASGAGWVDD